MSSLNDRVAIVTGAASGIGEACAKLFAERGARVVVSDLPDSGGEQLAASLREQYDTAVMFVPCDIAEPDQTRELVERTAEEFGRLDAAVNNAGIRGEMTPLAETTLEDWQQVIDVNLTGVFLCMKAQIKQMLDDGGGAIVNLSSVAGQVGFANLSPYTATKHGLVGLTRTAALEYSNQGIRINAVGPACIETPMVEDMTADPQRREQLLGAHPIGRFGTPREVAELIAFLSGQEASFITGSYFPIDGGYLAQ